MPGKVSSLIGKAFWIATAVSISVSGALAQSNDQNNWYSLEKGGIISVVRNYVDFNSTRQAGAWPTLGGGQKYVPVKIEGSGGCYKVFTEPKTNANGDTRIWYKKEADPVSGYKSLNDDINGTLFSSARIWVEGTSYPNNLFLAISAYSTTYNAMDFTWSIQNMNTTWTTPAQCDDGASPFLKYINGVFTVIRGG
ncbi:MAG: hypothetical protein JWP91_627 [Fibrobacteres bacterium]|nr:hypothetical protein [Fibrobacterota bacterium]